MDIRCWVHFLFWHQLLTLVWVGLRLWLYFLPSWVCKGLQEFMWCKFSHLRVHAEAPCGRPPTSSLLFLSIEAHTDIRIRGDKLAAVSGHKTDEQDPLHLHPSRRMFSKLWCRTRTECRIVFSCFKNLKVGYTGFFTVAVSKRSIQTKTGKWKVVDVLPANPRKLFAPRPWRPQPPFGSIIGHDTQK